MAIQTASLTSTPTTLDSGTSESVWVKNTGTSRVTIDSGGQRTHIRGGRQATVPVSGAVAASVLTSDGGSGTIAYESQGTRNVARDGGGVVTASGGVTRTAAGVISEGTGTYAALADVANPATATGAALGGTFVRRTAGSSATPATLPYLTAADYGAAGDGVTDDTAALQAVITAALNNATGIRTVRLGQAHKVTGPLSYSAGRGLRLVGQSRAQGTAITSTYAGVLLSNGSDSQVTRTDGAITASSTTLTGSGFTGKQGVGISVAGAGTGGAPLSAVISSVTSDTQVTLNIAASTTVASGATYSLYAWDSNLYDGVQSLFIEDVLFKTSGGVTALSNGTGNYLAGSTCIQDWRGGDVQLRRVTIQGFDTGFSGVQSDVNRWDGVELYGNRLGAYLGPRSDQFTCTALYAALNDRALDMDRPSGQRFIGCQFVGNGASGVNPIRIRSSWAAGASGIIFDNCWFEHLQGYSAAAVEAFVEIGIGDLVTSTDIHFENPTILGNASGTLPRAQYLVKCDRGDNISIVNPNGQYWKNLDAMVRFTGTTSPSVLLQARDPLSAMFTTSNGGSGTPSVTTVKWGAAGFAGGLNIGTGAFTAGNGSFSGRVTSGLGKQTLAANGAVTFNSNTASQFQCTLQANATSSSISNPPGSNISGLLTISWTQDATGGRTYAWPTNCKFAGGSAPSDTTANKTTSVTFWYDGTNWNEISRAVAVG